MDLKERISKIIAYSELSPSEFADEIDVQRSSISHITSGRNKPSLDFLIKIKSRFPEIKWEWLIEDQGEMLQQEEKPTEKPETTAKKTTATLPDLFSLINDDSFGITESEDRIESKPVRESNIPLPTTESPKISDSQRLATTDKSAIPEPIDSEPNKIKKIVFFYENGKFETFESL